MQPYAHAQRHALHQDIDAHMAALKERARQAPCHPDRHHVTGQLDRSLAGKAQQVSRNNIKTDQQRDQQIAQARDKHRAPAHPLKRCIHSYFPGTYITPVMGAMTSL